MHGNAWLLAETGPSTASIWGIVGSIGLFVASHIVWEWWQTRSKRELLKHVLLMECFGTLRKLTPVLQDLEKAAGASFQKDRLSFISRFPATITFTGASAELPQLLSLLPKPEGSDLLRFTDRWSRLLLLIQCYEHAYDAAVQAAAKVDGTSTLQERLCDEYITQAVSALNDCYRLGNALCDVACKIIRRYGPVQDHDLRVICDEWWQAWADHAAAHKRHAQACQVGALVPHYAGL
jgi:hypothetical protein